VLGLQLVEDARIGLGRLRSVPPNRPFSPSRRHWTRSGDTVDGAENETPGRKACARRRNLRKECEESVITAPCKVLLELADRAGQADEASQVLS
jgi:hypothetical protein